MGEPLWWAPTKWCSTVEGGQKIGNLTKEGTMCAPFQHEDMPTLHGPFLTTNALSGHAKVVTHPR